MPPWHLLSMGLLLLLLDVRLSWGLRCYVCGGLSGRPCDELRLSPRRRSPYIRPDPLPGKDGSKQWTECNDLINNKGCIKQVVNDVVLLRACWMQGIQGCLRSGDAEMCTCTTDLCNGSPPRSASSPSSFLCLLACLLLSFLCHVFGSSGGGGLGFGGGGHGPHGHRASQGRYPPPVRERQLLAAGLVQR